MDHREQSSGRERAVWRMESGDQQSLRNLQMETSADAQALFLCFVIPIPLFVLQSGCSGGGFRS